MQWSKKLSDLLYEQQHFKCVPPPHTHTQEPGLHMEVGGLTDSTTDHHTLPDLTLPDLHHRETGSGNTAHHSTRIGGREPGNGRLKKRYGYSSREQQYGDLSPLKELSSGGAWRPVAVADRVT